jgi:hypothetical protein
LYTAEIAETAEERVSGGSSKKRGLGSFRPEMQAVVIRRYDKERFDLEYMVILLSALRALCGESFCLDERAL